MLNRIVDSMLGADARPKTFAQVARENSTHPATIFRWCRHGLLLGDGTRLRLKATRIGGRWKVYPEDLAAFLSRLNDRDAGTVESSPPQSPAARRKTAERVARELDAIGIRPKQKRGTHRP